jgi:hypothetical protein
MKRRENIKLLLAGSIAAGITTTADSCKNNESAQELSSGASSVEIGIYGRTDEEKKHDAKVIAETFFTKDEYKAIGILSDIIIPKDEISGSATDAGVPEFIEFMMKDQPHQQLPMRGGLQWLNNQCQNKFNKPFIDCTEAERIAIIEAIAYPDKAAAEMKPGVKFFNMMRNLVATGFYTSQIGIKDIGYKGNQPNEWDGVSPEVMVKHNVALEEKYLNIYVKPSERQTIMTWT